MNAMAAPWSVPASSVAENVVPAGTGRWMIPMIAMWVTGTALAGSLNQSHCFLILEQRVLSTYRLRQTKADDQLLPTLNP